MYFFKTRLKNWHRIFNTFLLLRISTGTGMYGFPYILSVRKSVHVVFRIRIRVRGPYTNRVRVRTLPYIKNIRDRSFPYIQPFSAVSESEQTSYSFNF